MLNPCSDLPAALAKRMLLNCLKPEWADWLLRDGQQLLQFLGIEATPGSAGRQAVEEFVGAARGEVVDCPVERRLEANVAAMTKLLGFGETEGRLLVYFCVIAVFPHFEMLAVAAAGRRARRKLAFIADCTGLPVGEVARALAPNGKLRESGLLRRLDANSVGLGYELENEELASHLIEDEFDPKRVIATLGARGVEPNLAIKDYPHIATNLKLLVPYLRTVLRERRPGVNICIYGPPGTGKTELARVLGKVMRCGTFEPAYLDSDGDAVPAEQRFNKLRCALHFLGKERILVVCDEAEDFFRSNMRCPAPKLWINRLVETNETPILWLSNSLAGMDPAMLRRFDFVFELPVPPKEHRRKILSAAIGKQVTKQVVEALSECDVLSPAIVHRASDVVSTVGGKMSREDRGSALRQLVSQTLRAQGHELQNKPRAQPSLTYDPDAAKASVDLARLVAGLREQPEGRLCLCGPPGTGKTAFGRWLAGSLARPLHAHRLSDLLSMFVGGTERQLARAFHQAHEEGAVLLLDEVDSLLADRGQAVRSWEVTQVNEMLTQMEEFRGILVATTNRLESLDAASRRRFDLTVEFGYLDRQQLEQLYRKVCADLKLEPVDRSAYVPEIRNATPGDFAALVRQHRFNPFGSTRDFANSLVSWCAGKPDGADRKAIGFNA